MDALREGDATVKELRSGFSLLRRIAKATADDTALGTANVIACCGAISARRAGTGKGRSRLGWSASARRACERRYPPMTLVYRNKARFHHQLKFVLIECKLS